MDETGFLRSSSLSNDGTVLVQSLHGENVSVMYALSAPLSTAGTDWPPRPTYPCSYIVWNSVQLFLT